MRIQLSTPHESFQNLIRGKEYSKEVIEFAKDIIDKTVEHLSEVDSMIKSILENWEWNRVCAMDKAILGIAVTELLYFPENPPKVVINEALEIAKEYSTEKSDKFINGILDRIAKEKGLL